MRRPKKSKYKSVVIKKKRYYFYKITWVDITGDAGHADLFTAEADLLNRRRDPWFAGNVLK